VTAIQHPLAFARQQWPQALALAQRACRYTLARLRRGEGGFYQADDFLQDLYCAWAALCADHAHDEQALWRAWRGLLYAGGREILRHPPQRLWQRPDLCLPLPSFERQPAPAANGQASQRWRQVVGDIWRLPLAQRQIIYLRALAAYSSHQVGQSLGLSPASVDARLRRARLKLGRVHQEDKEL